jgi:hypothetical protein
MQEVLPYAAVCRLACVLRGRANEMSKKQGGDDTNVQ